MFVLYLVARIVEVPLLKPCHHLQCSFCTLTMLAFHDPHGVTSPHFVRLIVARIVDVLLLKPCHHLQCSNSTLTSLAFRNPRGTNFIGASRDLLLQVLSKCHHLQCSDGTFIAFVAKAASAALLCLLQVVGCYEAEDYRGVILYVQS